MSAAAAVAESAKTTKMETRMQLATAYNGT